MSAWQEQIVETCVWLRRQKMQLEKLAAAAGEPVVRATALQRAQGCGTTVAHLERVLVEFDVPLPGAPANASRANATLRAVAARCHGAIARALVANTGSETAVHERLLALVAAMQRDAAPADAIAAVMRIDPPRMPPGSAAEGEPTCERRA
jgi:hypothetical protein